MNQPGWRQRDDNAWRMQGKRLTPRGHMMKRLGQSVEGTPLGRYLPPGISAPNYNQVFRHLRTHLRTLYSIMLGNAQGPTVHTHSSAPGPTVQRLQTRYYNQMRATSRNNLGHTTARTESWLQPAAQLSYMHTIIYVLSLFFPPCYTRNT